MNQLIVTKAISLSRMSLELFHLMIYCLKSQVFKSIIADTKRPLWKKSPNLKVFRHVLSRSVYSCHIYMSAHFFFFISYADAQDFCTPAMPVPRSSMDAASSTPRTRIRRERVIQPSIYLLPPYSSIISTKHQDALYQKVIIHTQDSEESKLKK